MKPVLFSGRHPICGFAGYSEVEIFSQNTWWEKPMGEVLDTCIERHRSMV